MVITVISHRRCLLAFGHCRFTFRCFVDLCHGDANGGIEWDVKDCMQSRQDYIIAVKGRRDTRHEEDSPGDAATRAESCGVRWRGGLSRRHVGDTCGVSRTSEEGRFGSVTWREVW